MHKNLEDYTIDLGRANKYLQQTEKDDSCNVLGIKSNTEFPKEVELHNNDIKNYGKITKQKVLSKT